MFSVDGLASGLDTAAIIEGALASRQARIDRLNVQRQGVVDEQTLFKTIEGQLLGLQGSLRNILRSSNNAFDSKVATSSDVETADVTASSSAVAGTYQLRVVQLAQPHQIKSNGYSDESDLVGTGTLKIQVGSRAQATIELDENSTVQSLVGAINSQSDDVRATLIDDGSSDRPLRVMITSRHSGEDQAITVESELQVDAGSPVLDFSGPAVQEAQDAQVKIGTGEGAISISSENNQFDDLIAGVSIDVLRADPEKDVLITVSEDTTSVVDAVEGFVTAYNDVVDVIDSNSSFDPESNQAGLLLGNRSAANIQSKLRTALNTVVQGVDKNVRTLTSVGIDTTANGKLSLNRSRLQDLLAGRVEGVGIDDIRRLFAIDGQSDNPGVEFLLGTNNTSASPQDPVTGEPLPYEVEITRAASVAQIEGAAPLLETTIINSTNSTFQIEVDRTPITVQIPSGSYGREALADQLQTLINTSPDRAGRSVKIDVGPSNQLVIASESYGNASRINILTGAGNAPLGLLEDTSSVGQDVAGVFRVQLPGDEQRIREEAVGNGRTLTGKTENQYTAQLQVRSTLQNNQVGAATDAHLTITRGIGAALDTAITELLRQSDGQTGELVLAQDRFVAETAAIDENIQQLEERIESRRESLVRQFAALESTLADLQSTGDALTSSLLNL